MSDPVRVESDAFVEFIENTERRQFGPLLHVQAHDGVAVAFYRQAGATADAALLLGVVLDEEAPGEWEVLGATEISPGGSRHVTARPSRRGDWVVAIFGSAPTHASAVVVDHGGVKHSRPIRDGVYAFVARAPTQPESSGPDPRFG